MCITMAKTLLFFPERYFLTIVFITFFNFSYAQNTTPAGTPNTAQDSFPIPTEDSYEDARLVQGRLARERTLRKEARRQRFLERLPKNHNPRTATLLALIPGAGQIYNRRYWKLPIVLGGVGTFGFFMIKAKVDFECLKRTYAERVDSFSSTNYTCNNDYINLTDDNLKITRDNARSDSELLIIGFTVFYGLTIIDAFVDAHLINFDISDDLSMQLKPSFNYNPLSQQVSTGLGLSITARPLSPLKYPVQF